MTIKMENNKDKLCSKCKTKISDKKKVNKEEKNFEINSLDSSGNVRLDSSRKFTMSENPHTSMASENVSIAEAP